MPENETPNPMILEAYKVGGDKMKQKILEVCKENARVYTLCGAKRNARIVRSLLTQLESISVL